jgi:hypothetical protein
MGAMKTLLPTLLLAATLSASAAEPIDLEARRQSVVTLKEHITARQERLDRVATDIRTRGQAIDAQIEKLVTRLTGLKDSQDSKRRVSQIKGEAVAGLKRMIQVFGEERREIAEALRTGSPATTDTLLPDMAKIDAQIQKRANDIIELVKSMPGGEDISKYEQDSETYYSRGDVTYENSRISEAWRQNRRDSVQSEKLRREVKDALERAIADLNQRKATVTTALKASGITDADKEIQQQELARLNNVLQERQGQLADVITPSTAPEEAASGDEADHLRKYLADTRQDIATDFRETLRLYKLAVDERVKIAGLRENLTAREKWLAENDPAAKKAD